MTTTYLQPHLTREEDGRPASPVPAPKEVTVRPGPALLAGIENGPSLAAHRAQYGPIPHLTGKELHALVKRVQVRGRGGAAFPFAIKLETILKGSRPILVVNMSEGELASAKDHALALTRPHLVLDGVVATAKALRTRKVHVVLPGERPGAAAAMKAAIAERSDGVNIYTSTASSRFVAGQARAVVELLSGRPNLPTTTWAPEAIKGLNGRPTLLSNGETWARVGLLVLRGEEEYTSIGTAEEPGATLLTLNMPGSVPIVAEAAYGDRLRDYIPFDRHGLPAMVGGFHGAWATWETLASAKVSVNGMRAMGSALGAGLVLSSPQCPVTLTTRTVEYLAGQSAQRCGPCLNGLPALAKAVTAVHDGEGGLERVEQLANLVVRRGACAHPDGTVRLVNSMLSTFADEVEAHAHGRCNLREGSHQLVGDSFTRILEVA
ncbi:NADH-ubiquinone oxidoreductase-F iron-sulfur binding region domain-containing protein [Nocardioides sp.]|uniref:NADH-ubiquinone oxidoreductase-F iron-sulfur binding region domain-containing protein n=1 Tax=Nocardioides sp. TaxID=35761 RepID=UPI002D8115FA|nr:NADH-ubiquinone oxidoreductase-F iron-sulfur binding region domain-containing protein [Nocardioides sp.]HET8959140.1 NADH-ubiquinone oxidoreductase-F iron-sulfur binding region domain-containing protein [Nocardioides sp.]